MFHIPQKYMQQYWSLFIEGNENIFVRNIHLYAYSLSERISETTQLS